MKISFTICFAAALFVFTSVSCSDETSLVEDLDAQAEDYSFTTSASYGFDDFSSAGACQGISIDESTGTAIVIGLKFSLPLFSQTFTITPDPNAQLEDYQWNSVSTALDDITALEDYTEVLTNTAGIRTMDFPIIAFMVKFNGGTDPTYFIAYKGTIQLTREDGPYDIMEGDLSFVEITGAGSDAKIVKNGEVLSVKNIYFEFSTAVQPD